MHKESIGLIILLACATCWQTASAQDYYPDYRNKRDNFKKVSQKDIRADLASFALAGIDESISKLPLRKIPVTSYGRNYILFENDDVKVQVNLVPFEADKHKIQKMEDHILKIDGKGYVGSYGKIPETSIGSVLVIIGKDTVAIPPQAYADIHDLQFGYTDGSGEMRSADAVYFSADNKKMYIYLLSRSDDGTYEVTWVIQDKQYVRRVLDFDLLKF